MQELELPRNWIGIIGAKRWTKPFGLCRRSTRTVEVYPVAWIPSWFGIRDHFTAITWNHEVLHAWGNPGCSHPWCLGFEGPFWLEYLAMPVQLLVGLIFCDECGQYYKPTTQ